MTDSKWKRHEDEDDGAVYWQRFVGDYRLNVYEAHGSWYVRVALDKDAEHGADYGRYPGDVASGIGLAEEALRDRLNAQLVELDGVHAENDE